MTMTKHPRHRAETIRIPLGLLILSLWKRPSSRTDFCPGSCDNPFPSSSYFITDNSTEPARSRFSALVIFLHMLACPYRRTKRRGANEEKVGGKRDAAGVPPPCFTVTVAFLSAAVKTAKRAPWLPASSRRRPPAHRFYMTRRGLSKRSVNPLSPKPRGLRYS
ncbi:hypothetical protein CHARACLAT_029329 [Characodon lateralis]|uniref:Secreted protein n=1 Tax=Characodon lateralis TaxID=208331 RepID=A0ABU7DPS4_9TELE|nr:hypothetical protein [Characodon lateralis]